MVLNSAMGFSSPKAESRLVLGALFLAQTQKRYQRDKPLIKYLVDGEMLTEENQAESHEGRPPSILSHVQRQHLNRLALESFREQMDLIESSGALLPGNRDRKLSGLATQSLTILCYSSFYLTLLSPSAQAAAVRQAASTLLHQLRDAVRQHENGPLLRDVMVDSFTHLLPPIAEVGGDLSRTMQAAATIARAIGPKFLSPSEDSDIDLLNDEFDSQQDPVWSQAIARDLPHDWLGSQIDPRAKRACLLSKANLYSYTRKDSSDNFESKGNIPPEWLSFVNNLSENDFIASGPLFLDLLNSETGVDESFAITVLRFLAMLISDTYEFSRSEAALCLTVEILTATSRAWPHANSKTVNVIKQIYSHIVKTVLANPASTRSFICVTNLLMRVQENVPDFLKDSSKKSPRTHLLELLGANTPAAVKFAAGSQLPTMFGRLVLADHEPFLDDIMKHLSPDPEWPEGAAVRLSILASLGSSWSTLSRKCLFALVEAPSLIPASLSPATSCVHDMSSRLAIEDPRKLFRLFASQIFYTWLGTNPLDSIPYKLFGYSNIRELLVDVQDEIVAQVVMRGRESEAEQVSALLEQPFRALLDDSFAKSAAYCVARDAAINPAADQTASDASKRLKRLIGRDRFAHLLSQRLPEVLSNLFKVLEREDAIVSSLQQHQVYAAASNALEEIISSGSSAGQLTVSQQPSFKSTVLLDEIGYLCRNLQREPGSLWTPAMYTFVFRDVASTIHTAVGELYACSVIRRLRILVSIAGDAALSGYSLEMALHFFQPYLKSQLCAADAMGLFRYLLSRGSQYLSDTPGFVAGLVFSTVLSLRAFIRGARDNTTQESDFASLMSKAGDFHSWLTAFADEYDSPIWDENAEAIFKRMTAAIKNLHRVGSACAGTAEGDLLLAILDDQRSNQPLLDDPARSQILSLLCKNFEMPLSYREDIVGLHQSSTAHAPVVWKSYWDAGRQAGYGLWVSRVLGRAYAESGFVDSMLLRETPQNALKERMSDSEELTTTSRLAILDKLNDMLHGSDQHRVGLAEKTLRMIINAVELDSDLQLSVDGLPQSVSSTFAWDSPKPREPTSVVCKGYENLPSTSDGIDMFVKDGLMRHICLYLLCNCPDDPFLSCLLPVVLEIRTIAEQILPFIIHLALLADYDAENIKAKVSKVVTYCFNNSTTDIAQSNRFLVNALLYLRTQKRPRETTQADRCHWLEVDFLLTAKVASQCNLFKTALLFLEISFGEQMQTKSRRTSSFEPDLPMDLLFQIFENLEDKDWIHGLQRPSSLQAVMSQMRYEISSFKRISFQSAYLDSQMRRAGSVDAAAGADMVSILNDLELSGLSKAMLSNLNSTKEIESDSMFQTARKLEQWDLPSQTAKASLSTTIYQAFQSIHDAMDRKVVKSMLDSCFQSTLDLLARGSSVNTILHDALETLAALSEIEDVLSSQNADDLQEMLEAFILRNNWMSNSR